MSKPIPSLPIQHVPLSEETVKEYSLEPGSRFRFSWPRPEVIWVALGWQEYANGERRLLVKPDE